VNTKDILDGGESLGTPAELDRWLVEHELLRGEGGARASGGDLRRAVELREALRLLLVGNTGLEVDSSTAFAVLDGVASRGRVGLCFEDCNGALVPAAHGVDGALGRIAIGVHEAISDGSWPRLKACRASDCEWAFIDHAKNHSRSWCSMRVCGNREKARAFRERQRGGEPVSVSSK
jgi:predicted RNA-binding Zn ribbon-like protein